jgi:ATP-dependent RNA helicase HelY
VSALTALRRGDVIAIPVGRRSGLAVVLETDSDPNDPRPLVLTEDKWAGRISAADFPAPAKSLGSMRLPRHVDHRTARSRRDLASALRSTGIVPPGRYSKRKSPAASDRELATLRRALRSHPCHTAPDREQLSRIGERYNSLARETETLRQKVAATTNSLARTFDRIVALLAEREYIEQEGHGITENGQRLSRIYSESDLLVAECLRGGLWKGLGPAELAGVVSTMVYESRQDGDTGDRGPTGPARHALARTLQVWGELRADEVRHKLPLTREPDFGFVSAIYKWARGEPLVDALLAAGDRGQALSAGDFVRWCRQVIDLLDQVQSTAPDREVRAAATKAVHAIRRGVVAIDAA